VAQSCFSASRLRADGIGNQAQERYEAEASRLLSKLADDMAHVAQRMHALLAHHESGVAHATELAGASECCRQWAERLKP
jgi:hypothetical protein